MAFKVEGNEDYILTMVSGDTEYIRLNVKDGDGNIIDITTDVGNTCTIGIKRGKLDTEFIVPEKVATLYEYDVVTQPYVIEFKFTDGDTAALLNYNGKERKALKAHFDIELYIFGTGDRTTLLSGELQIQRSIAGKVI